MAQLPETITLDFAEIWKGQGLRDVGETAQQLCDNEMAAGDSRYTNVHVGRFLVGTIKRAEHIGEGKVKFHIKWKVERVASDS